MHEGFRWIWTARATTRWITRRSVADLDTIRTVAWTGDSVRLIDQTALPGRLEYVEILDWRRVVDAIKEMVVRGAPAIGCTAALGMVLAAREYSRLDADGFRGGMNEAAESLRLSRPTAVNLSWAIDRILRLIDRETGHGIRLSACVEREAILMLEEDLQINRALGKNGAALLPDSGNVLTHCNAGALCAVGYGTALGVIRAAVESGKSVHVYADETRPRLQGMKLTAWELKQDGIPVTVIADNMAAVLMRDGKVDCIVVGADRIAANGDTANKVGTYGLAVLAHHHGIPFYVAAPLSTVDYHAADGSDIPIEERSETEMTHLSGISLGPADVSAWNPAFDVTPAALISAIITESGVARVSYIDSLAGFRTKARI